MSIINRLKELYFKFRVLTSIGGLDKTISESMPCCYIFLAADYGNLGDVAITFAQKKFLQEKFHDYKIIELPAADSIRNLRNLRKTIKPNDILTIVGGGNMGDMYGDIELLRLLAVKYFKNNKIILFPQTIHYSDSQEAKWLLSLSQKIYTKHKNLTMCAREKISYEYMRKVYPNVHVLLTPDIVMGLDERNNAERKTIATFCLRDDLEKKDNSAVIASIKQECKMLGLDIQTYDTHIGSGRFTEAEKYTRLYELWEKFKESKLIVTDRLHGMIFAYITGTPAFVLPNSNFKVLACYEWIKDCGYIHFISNAETPSISSLLSEPHKDISKKIAAALTPIC